MWDEVPADQQNGLITGYTITYHSQTENDDGSVQVNTSVRQMELTNLKEFVNYNITVFSSTAKGDGPASDPIVVRTDQDSKLSFFVIIKVLFFWCMDVEARMYHLHKHIQILSDIVTNNLRAIFNFVRFSFL